LKGTKEERGKRKDIRTDIAMAVEKLVMERLGNLEDAVLLGNRLYKKPTPERVDSYLQEKIMPHIQAKIMLEKSDLELGENTHFEIELQNIGKTPVLITRIEDIVPTGFELTAHSDAYHFVNTYLDMHGMRLDPYITENIGVTLRSTQKGTFLLAPRILYTSDVGLQMSSKPEPASISVSETILPDRILTGFQDLDNLLFGGIPKNYAVVLTSASCDERDLLIKRYIETGAKEHNNTLHITVDATSVRSLAEEFQANFHVLVCNLKVDKAFENLPNVFRVAGVENLTELNIVLESMLRRLDESRDRVGRACLEILSDVLLEHHAVQTRRWLSRLIPELRSRGFTTLAVLNPHMHASEELHAILDLFEGEISIYGKEANDGLAKYLRIKKMYNQRYLESELLLKKTRLMTMPLTLSCCTRTSNL
jgi:KaiC/GvpD/RAD55 family RecA-like ATPase